MKFAIFLIAALLSGCQNAKINVALTYQPITVEGSTDTKVQK
jgi:hypothetical protein